ncbi:uncharacterized protein [Gossypium hirsutum]|uniref:Uncharacterized protein n=1 Tax=Gossypium hirsutum TaxID=3635 RepID=A0A1U8IAJ7_GOSHI|nr:uncharacterized protein LOC107894496 [Gossypium hirsutum]
MKVRLDASLGYWNCTTTESSLGATERPWSVYAARPREDGDAPDVIRGILIESTTSEVIVLSLLGQSVKVNKLFRDVPLEVQGAIFLADLMELPFGEFDLVLGMDCLVKHRESLDFATKRVVLRTAEHSEVVIIEERQSNLSNVIFASRVEKLVRNGFKDIRTIKDFLDVFLQELPGLPPNREVKFGIQLLSGMALVSIAPYRIAPNEFVELKAQIQDLLDRRFIRPSVFP